MSKLVITSLPYREQRYLACVTMEGGQARELRIQKEGEHSILGNIYVGMVENINQNIRAAFVRFGAEGNGYFPLEEAEQVIYTRNVKPGHQLTAGDQILVQVGREAMKGKLPYLTSNLTFTGKYMVLTTGDKKFGLSKKLSAEDRHRLSGYFSEEIERADKEYGCIVRTNAAEASEEELEREFSHLKKLWYKTAVEGRMRTVFSLLYSPTSLAVSSIRDAYTADLEGIETDDPAIAEEIRSYLNEISPGKANDVSLYDDKLLPLYKCISLEKTLDEICQKKVWLKSGGFLVIEQTEAFVSIDVNTGKYTDKKKAEETYRKINLEAADEIGRQLRLRNLSGIIMVDFINMENQDHVDELFHVMKKILKKDTVPAKAVDITALGIMEITRKKVRRPVIEEL